MCTSTQHMLMPLRDHIHLCVHRSMYLLTHSHKHTCNFTLAHSRPTDCLLTCSPGYSHSPAGPLIRFHMTTLPSHTPTYVPALTFTHTHTHMLIFTRTRTFCFLICTDPSVTFRGHALACCCCQTPPPTGQATALDPPLHPTIQTCFTI